ncbi:hypothetical protein LCGC14_1611620 [marine sediment metagenome]|uniref:Uncharacterized protein n=1 Tax=marine sediment metagenome TaxID=412755 RepID=A0A0F9IUU8_9ZZZZ
MRYRQDRGALDNHDNRNHETHLMQVNQLYSIGSPLTHHRKKDHIETSQDAYESRNRSVYTKGTRH